MASILDLGCGTGVFLPMLRTCFPGARIHGVDIVAPNVAAATERGYDTGDCFDVCSVGQMLAPSEFELVLCIEVIQYLSPGDRTRLFAGIERVSRPEGLAVLVYPNLESLVRKLHPIDSDHCPHPYTTRELREEAGVHGLLPQRFFGTELITRTRMAGQTVNRRLARLAFRLGVVFEARGW